MADAEQSDFGLTTADGASPSAVIAAALVDAPTAGTLGALGSLDPLSLPAGLQVDLLVALDRHAADEVPAHEFADRRRDIRAGDAERSGDLLRRHRPAGDVKQRVDLTDGTIDAPGRPHISPLQHEPLQRRRQLAGSDVISICYFCHDRNIRQREREVKPEAQHRARLSPPEEIPLPLMGRG